jgi:hypothetical protein
MELSFDVVGSLQTPATVAIPVAELNEGGIGAGAQAGLVQDTIAPQAPAAWLNDDTRRGVSSIVADADGIRKINLAFTEPVTFDNDAIVARKVTFSGTTEVLGETLTPASVTGSGTDSMAVTFAAGTAANTWIKVTLAPDRILDRAHNRLGAGPAGAMSFYVGSLGGDGDGDGIVDGLDYGVWQSGYGHPNATAATGDFNGDGVVDGEDYGVWQSQYGHTLAVLPKVLMQSDVVSSQDEGQAWTAPPAETPTTGSDATVAVASVAPAAAMVASASPVAAIHGVSSIWINAVETMPATGLDEASPTTNMPLAPEGGVDLLAMPALVAPRVPDKL